MNKYAAYIFLLLAGCSPAISRMDRAPSPTGDMIVAAVPNESKADPTKYRCLQLILMDHTGNTLSTIQTGASDGQKWAVGWMKTGSIVVLQSSDIGTQAYAAESNGFTQVMLNPEIEARATELKRSKYEK